MHCTTEPLTNCLRMAEREQKTMMDDRELFEAIQFYEDKSSRRWVEADTSSPTSSRVEADSSSPTSSPSPDQKDPPSTSIATASNSLIFILRTRDDKSATSDAKPLSANDIDVWEVKSNVFYSLIKSSGEVVALAAPLESVDFPQDSPSPRLEPVTGPPGPDEMFYQPDETGRPGRGTVGKLVSKAGAYVALRVDSSDPKVAHLETYDREGFVKRSEDRYTLAALTILRCLTECGKWEQVVMYYASKNFDHRYYLLPVSGNEIEIKAVKNPHPSEEKDINATYRLWTNKR